MARSEDPFSRPLTRIYSYYWYVGVFPLSLFLVRKRDFRWSMDRKGAIRRRMGQRIGGRDSSGTNETRRSTFRRWLNIFLIGFNGYFYRHNGCFSTAGVLFPFSPCNNNNNNDDILDTIGEDESLTGEWNFVCKRFLILVRFDCLIIINGRVSRFLEAEWLNC